jgi:hypothetical protein
MQHHQNGNFPPQFFEMGKIQSNFLVSVQVNLRDVNSESVDPSFVNESLGPCGVSEGWDSGTLVSPSDTPGNAAISASTATPLGFEVGEALAEGVRVGHQLADAVQHPNVIVAIHHEAELQIDRLYYSLKLRRLIE